MSEPTKQIPERWQQHEQYPDIILSNLPSGIDPNGRPFVAESVPKKYRPLVWAAPELLEALQELAESYRQLLASGDCGCEFAEDQPEYKNAMAAIAKATGQ